MTYHRSVAPRRLALACAVALGLAAGGCAPSIQPALKQSVDGALAEVTRSTRTYPAPTSFEPMPYAAGQWTRHKVVDGDGNPSILTYKILSKEGRAWWIEAVSESYFSTSVTKMLLEIPDRTEVAQVRVRAIEMRTDDGAVTRLDESNPALGFMNSLWEPVTESLIVDWEGATREDATAPAGTFLGAYKTTRTVSFGPVSATTTSWSHPEVPISGVVRADEVGGGSTQVLLDFGTSGAKSEL